MANDSKSRNCFVEMKDLERIKDLSLAAYEFMQKKLSNEKLADGRYELSDGSYVNIETYETKLRKDCRFESHRKYIDVQIIISGQELISVAKPEELKICEKYSEEKDIVFYENNINCVDFIIKYGEFLILDPSQAHMPCICIDKKSIVRKAVIKIPVK